MIRLTATIAITFIIVSFLPSLPASSAQKECSRKCVSANCDSFGIRYGKYCGVGHTGCSGEEPCDDVDACCMDHDECTTLHGVVGVECHEKLKRCLRRVLRSGKAGFSKKCPYSTVVPTIIAGMDMAILLGSGLGANFVQ